MQTCQQASKQASRSYRFDLLKAAAIIGVVLYHSGNLPNGYLGVEVFLVITGYFLMRGYLRKVETGSFSLLSFLGNRILRLWPLVIAISFLCLVLGYFSMLPDDYENLSESVVASSVFSENILSAITTRNYWNLGNNYKPLMHLWYLGVLVQSYIVLTVVFFAFGRISRRLLKISMAVVMVLSFGLFVFSDFSNGDKFYYIPFRLFEILIGALICIGINSTGRLSKTIANASFCIMFVLICVVMFFGTPFSKDISLIIEVLLTSFAVIVITQSDEYNCNLFSKVANLGVACFSVYIVHQPVMAFTRYFYSAELQGMTLAVDLFLTAILSIVFYIVFEKGIGNIIKRIGWVKSFIICGFCSLIVIAGGLFVYLHAGVMRDVPELDVYKATAYRGMHAVYVDIPYKWDRDFVTDKIHILVVGDSMARDWCNILNESSRSDEFEVSYIYGSRVNNPKYDDRLRQADYIFYASLGDSSVNIPVKLNEFAQEPNFYVVGVKNFGESNGQIYQRRFDKDYFGSSIRLGKTNMANGMTFEEQDSKQKAYWGSHYIDMIDCIKNEDGSIPVFSDTNKYISSDTTHLTRNGCIYYGKILDLSFIKHKY